MAARGDAEPRTGSAATFWREDGPALATFVVLSALYLVVFLVLYVVLRKMAPADIVYYSGLATLGAALALDVALTAAGRRVLPAGPATRLRPAVVVPALVAALLAGYGFLITVPSLLDRSISIYLIGTVARAGDDGLTLPAIQRAFVQGYVDGTSAVERRLHEQIVSGTIVRDGDRYRITPRGRLVYRTNVELARLFNIPDRYVVGGDPMP